MLSRRSAFFLLCLFCAPLVGAAAGSQPREEEFDCGYNVIHWSAESGLPQNTVRALAQTPDGYLWIGTLAGLARFDGLKFTVFDHSNTPEMASDAINGLAVDRLDGSLWVATGDGILHMKAHQFIRSNPYPSKIVGAVWAAESGGVWLPGRDGEVGLLQERAGLVGTWKITEQSSDNVVQQVDDRGPDNVWVLSGRSLFQLNASRGSVTRMAVPTDRENGGFCHSFFREDDGTTWLCGWSGCWQGTNGQWTLLQKRGDGSANPVQVLRTASRQTWVQCDNLFGDRVLRRWVKGSFEAPAIPNLPADLSVFRLLEDREGSLWLGGPLGLWQLRPKYLRIYSTANGLASDEITTLCQGPDATIWVGTRRGVSGIRDNEVVNLPFPDQLDNVSAAIKAVDRQNRIWAGWHGALSSVYEAQSWHSFPGPHSEFPHGLSAALQDSKGRMWFASSEAVFVEDHGNWTRYDESDGLSDRSVATIYEDRRGEIWFGTKRGGLNRLRDGKVTSYLTRQGDFDDCNWWIHEDSDGIFWVGTQNGLKRFTPPGVKDPISAERGDGSFFTFTLNHGLRDMVINNVQEDDLGALWLSGLRGVFRVSRRELNAVVAGTRNTVQVLALGEADGMLNCECNGGDFQPSGCKDQRGRIWFPTARGVVMIDPEHILANRKPPGVVIERVLANDEVIHGFGNANSAADRAADFPIRPGHGAVVEIRYAATTFVAPERVTFKYMLEGYDRKWRGAAASERVAFYTNLKPGSYRFRVSACNNHGFWSPESASFGFTLAPTFKQTAWYPVIWAVGLITVTAAIAFWRLQWQRRVWLAERTLYLERERSRIARDLHDDFGTALTGLALELDVARRTVGQSPLTVSRLEATAQRTRDLAGRMREVVWAVNPKCDTVSSLASFLEQQAAQFLNADGLRGRFSFPEEIPMLAMDANVRHQLALALREALTNVVRHAQAREVSVSLSMEARDVVIRVRDDGVGYASAAGATMGHGIGNMRDRLEQIGGAFGIERLDAGTEVTFRVPLRSSQEKKGAA